MSDAKYRTANAGLEEVAASSARMPPSAVVVGLCAHGLAVTKSLSKAGINTLALEANPGLPGNHTRHARVVRCADINGGGLVDALLSVRAQLSAPPVLFLTNDRMVRVVAERWPELEADYLLSWADSRATIAKLLDKRHLETRCREVGLNYPASLLVSEPGDVAGVGQRLEFPIVVKPAQPLGRFKILRLTAPAELRRVVEEFRSDLPFIAQKCIDGGDESLSFCALYLSQGKELARFDGRKIRSRPPTLGGTVAAEPCPDQAVYTATRAFFDGLSLSGSVSLEIKKDPQGRLWVIEPTVGRTDFWLALCSANGVNLPAIEYAHVLGSTPAVSLQGTEYRWFDTEHDPLCYLRYLPKCRSFKQARSAVFPYWDPKDTGPFVAATRLFAKNQFHRIGRGIRRHFSFQSPN